MVILMFFIAVKIYLRQGFYFALKMKVRKNRKIIEKNANRIKIIQGKLTLYLINEINKSLVITVDCWMTNNQSIGKF